MTYFGAFSQDRPWTDGSGALAEYRVDGQIDGVVLNRLVSHGDPRGGLTVLLSEHYGTFEPRTPHVYLVEAEPKSVRAWVYHERQEDRLAYTNGDFVVALFDIRPDSPTYEALNVLEIGEANKTLVTIPRFVVHGVFNRGSSPAYFVNMPTRAYDPADPDKLRLKYPNALVPFTFE